jgi:hypothetical protein
MAPAVELWRLGRIGDAEFVTCYLLGFALQLHGRKALIAAEGTGLKQSKSLSSPLLSNLLDFTALDRSGGGTGYIEKFLNKFDLPVAEFLDCFQLRGVPLSAHRALQRWFHTPESLHLFLTVPTPLEVLEMQCLPRRCISVIIDREQMKDYIQGERDAFGFCLHDLIHAEHFYAHPEIMAGQIGFYRSMRQVLNSGLLQHKLEKSPGFRKDFEYVFSDMNAYATHLMKTLKAVIRNHFPGEQMLLFDGVLDAMHVSGPARAAALRLNTPEFQMPCDDLLLQNYFGGLVERVASVHSRL